MTEDADGKLLKGKWEVAGEKKEQIRLHTSRFGFGKVSANTYGHGNEDRSYWGVLSREGDAGMSEKEKAEGSGLITCDGAIMAGLGLEPVSIGSFRLLEIEGDGDYSA